MQEKREQEERSKERREEGRRGQKTQVRARVGELLEDQYLSASTGEAAYARVGRFESPFEDFLPKRHGRQTKIPRMFSLKSS